MKFSYVEDKKFWVTDGIHTVILKSAGIKQSKRSRDMLVLELFVPASNRVPFYHYIVETDSVDKAGNRIFDKQVSRFYDAFGISPSDDLNRQDVRDKWTDLQAMAEFVTEDATYTDSSGETRQTTQKRIRRFLSNELAEEIKAAADKQAEKEIAAETRETAEEPFVEEDDPAESVPF